jgi:hypothetical protein
MDHKNGFELVFSGKVKPFPAILNHLIVVSSFDILSASWSNFLPVFMVFLEKSVQQSVTTWQFLHTPSIHHHELLVASNFLMDCRNKSS